MPAVPAAQEMVSELLMMSGPKSPASRQLISPPAAVFERAPAKVLQGAVRLQGLASSPVPDTQVRASRACAGEAAKNGNASATMASESAGLRMMNLLCVDRLARAAGWAARSRARVNSW